MIAEREYHKAEDQQQPVREGLPGDWPVPMQKEVPSDGNGELELRRGRGGQRVFRI